MSSFDRGYLLLLTAGLIGSIVVNVTWGGLLGFVATGIKKAVNGIDAVSSGPQVKNACRKTAIAIPMTA